MDRRFRIVVLTIIITVLGGLCLFILMPFLSSLAWAAVFGIVFYPLYQYILRYVRSPSVAAAASVIVVVVAILAPLSYLSYLLVLEIENISPRALTIEGLTEMYSHSFLQPFIQKVLSLFDLSEEQALGYVANAAGTVSRQLLSRLSAGLGNVASAVVSFAIMVFVLFFFFRDGRKYVGNIQELLPLSEKNKEYVSGQVKDVVVSTIYGGVAVALAQGIVSSLGYMLVGIHSPLLWGLTTAIASFIPVVGSSLVWGPLCIYLFVKGAIAKGIILALIGVVGIGTVDNILRPLLIRGRARMSFLFTFLTVLGGMEAFGLLGIVVGPLVFALFTSILNIVKAFEEKDNPA